MDQDTQKSRDLPGPIFSSRRPEAVGRVDPPCPGRLHRRTEPSAQPLLARMVSHHAIPLIQILACSNLPPTRRLAATPCTPILGAQLASSRTTPRRQCLVPGLDPGMPWSTEGAWRGLGSVLGGIVLDKPPTGPPRHTSWGTNPRSERRWDVSTSRTGGRGSRRADTDILRSAGHEPAWDISRSIPPPPWDTRASLARDGPSDDAIPSSPPNHVSHLPSSRFPSSRSGQTQI